MSLNDALVSRAIATLIKKLELKKRFELTDLTLQYSSLEELPREWQDLIKEEMAKATK
jgi:hypothetical protein